MREPSAVHASVAGWSLPLLVLLPLGGAWLAGAPVRRYLEFPPISQYVDHAPFSWAACTAMAVLALPFLAVLLRACRPGPSPARPAPRRALPGWGWCGLAFGAAAWVVAWTRWPVLAPIQAHTFTPLWLAYIVVINALRFRRVGACLLTNRPGYLLRLFPLSAAFWWFFEYLNRFVQNWRYEGIAPMGAWEYFLFATLAFSTVLPAVMSTYEWLAGTRLGHGAEGLPAFRMKRPRVWAAFWFTAAAGSLAALSRWPNFLFPFLWLSPLILLVSIQALAGRPTLFRDLETGHWRRLALLAVAALVCGFFWEMWNYFSLARWVYQIPWVGRFHVFEMPVLGYLGYLPFGWECAVLAAWAGGRPCGGAGSPAVPILMRRARLTS